MPVSANPEVAASVGFWSGGNLTDPSKKFCLIEISVPKLSTLSMDGAFNIEQLGKPNSLIIGPGFQKKDEHSDPGIEFFLTDSVPTDQINNVKVLEAPPPLWERQ